MVGYDLEDKAYCMELTYNYGLDSYKPGTGLSEFGIFVPDVAAAKAASTALGYREDSSGCIVGPDAYRFRLLALPSGRSERFLYIMCRVANLAKSVSFYKDVLGMSDAELPAAAAPKGKAAAVSYSSKTHPHGLEPVTLVFFEDGVKPTITPWEGRHAFALSAEEVKALHARYKKEFPDKIMHDEGNGPISLQEKLGTLFIFIARDADGYELCLVSRETMLPAAVEAVTNYDPKALDWNTRDKRISAIEAAGKKVEKIIAENPVVLFSKEWCPFCRKAKDSLESIEAKFFVEELESQDRKPLVDNPKAYQEYLAAKTNLGTSVPKGFVKGECIGGGDDIVSLKKNGQLLQKCIAVGAVVLAT
eukprot:CAMPEP_0197701356 /NCGR_PEP_ID=MMETSP1338-20131121/123098_1 /TAXON_ID=43686 ORGANISM="Pelagodinium beii, Strain RCC1491" /NCGR_SAMPLE_ID=MMETSP1338 /ASSEMBLY_ACC=CAM_ASM_000754 /LENGTH=361 /DNA_ID=CAMNT_0043285045 /DNA_START=121 /DNA_END=1203 /DNA_ORIENTATION=+